jgi:hypothetical protein
MRVVFAATIAALLGSTIALATPDGLYLLAGNDSHKKQDYSGDMYIQHKGDVLQLSWHVGNGNDVSTGAIGYGDAIVAFCCGADLYLYIQKGDDAIGVWTNQNDKDFRTEVLYRKSPPALAKETPPPEDILGHYLISGSNPDATTYTGEVIVERDGKVLKVTKVAAGKHAVGLGLVFMNYLAVDYYGDSLAVYGPEQQGRIGVWTKWGSDKVGTERWVRAP